MATPVPPPTLVMVMNMDDVVTLDPHYAYETTNLMIHASTYDTLVEFRPSDLTKVSPRLADKWDVSSDGLASTFYLHPGVKFTSGNPVTAEDVRFSWTRLKSIKGNPSFYADVITTVQVINDMTVQVTLTDPSPAFMGIVAAPAWHLDSTLVRAKVARMLPMRTRRIRPRTVGSNSAGSGVHPTSWAQGEIVRKPTPTIGAASQLGSHHQTYGDPATALQCSNAATPTADGLVEPRG
jgi:peptide/nickel transport system substrate-binding protein